MQAIRRQNGILVSHVCRHSHLLDIDEAISKLAAEDPNAAKLVKLRFFAGLSFGEAAELLGLSRSTGYELWGHARAWLHCELQATRDLA
jgi:DNA-directed RNA polymerase specialized sigma24 family protein